MTRFLKIKWLVDIVLAVSLIAAVAGLIIAPKETSDAARKGLDLCLDVIIPSLFPFFVISSLAIELGFAQVLGNALEKVMRPVFRVSGPCSAAVVLGFLGGYPVGAKTAIALYEKGHCSKEEAERLLAFCNNSGPAFILGAVGAGILGSSLAGWILYLTHTAASLTIGIVFRFYKYSSPPSAANRNQNRQTVRLSTAFTHSVKSSFQSVFGICAFVIFFTVAIRLMYITGLIPNAAQIIGHTLEPFGVTRETVENLLVGLIEITSGLFSLDGSTSALLTGKLAMAAFMLGWAGFSVHCQVLSFIGESGLNTRTYVIGKLLHGIISAFYVLIVMQIWNFKNPVNSYLVEQVETLAYSGFWRTLSITATVIFGIVLGFVIITSLSAFLRYYSRKRSVRR